MPWHWDHSAGPTSDSRLSDLYLEDKREATWLIFSLIAWAAESQLTLTHGTCVRVNGFPHVRKKECPQPAVEVYPSLAGATLTLLPAASSPLSLHWPAGSSTCPWKSAFCPASKLQEDHSTEMASYEWIKLLQGNSSLTADIWQVSVQHSKIHSLLILKLQQPFFFHKLIFPCSATQKGTWYCCIFGDTGSYQEADCYPLVGSHLLKTARMKLSK